jgi:hypothetical protein
VGTIWTPGGEHPLGDDRGGAGGRRPPSDLGEELDEAAVAEALEDEEFAAELAEAQARLAETPARVVIANHAIGLFQLAALHLNQRPPSLVEGRLAIDAMAALVEGLGDRLGEEGAALRDALAQLRLAFVQLSDGDPAGDEG